MRRAGGVGDEAGEPSVGSLAEAVDDDVRRFLEVGGQPPLDRRGDLRADVRVAKPCAQRRQVVGLVGVKDSGFQLQGRGEGPEPERAPAVRPDANMKNGVW